MSEYNESNKDIHSESSENQRNELNELNEQTDSRKCEYCGAECKEIDLFCSKCGERLEFKPSLIYDDYRRDLKKSDVNSEIRRFIGANSDFYQRKFKVIDVSDSNFTWNWPAFLVSTYWLAYRKLYVQAGIIALIFFFLNLMGGFGTLIGFGISILVGLNANAYYRDYVNSQIEDVKDLSYEDRQEHYKQKGGTSTIAVIVTLVLVFLITLFKNIWFQMI